MTARKELAQAKRNLNPHKAAVVAMWLFSHRYAHEQRGGSMDFWDSLSDSEKSRCRELVERIEASPAETATATA